jgi:hypothetical protein
MYQISKIGEIMKSLSTVFLLLLLLTFNSCGSDKSSVPGGGNTFTVSEYLQNKATITSQELYSAMRSNKLTLENIFAGQSYTSVTRFLSAAIFDKDFPCRGSITTEEFTIVALVENNTKYQEQMNGEKTEYTFCSAEFTAAGGANTNDNITRTIADLEWATVEGMIAEMDIEARDAEFTVESISRGTLRGKTVYQLNVSYQGNKSILILDPTLPISVNPIIVESAGTDDKGDQYKIKIERTLKN